MSNDIANHKDKKQGRRFPLEYWMLTCEWDEVVTMPRTDGIIGEGKQFIRKQKTNQTVDVHPVVFGVSMLQQGYLNFVITFAMPISKLYFDLVMQPTATEQKVSDIAEKIGHETTNRAD